MYGRRRKFTRRPIRKFRGRFARKGKKISYAVKKYVKRELHRNLENKKLIEYAANQSINNALAGFANLTSKNLLLPIFQGTADNMRIGNQTKLVKGWIRGHVNLLPYDATTNPYPAPIWVKIWFVRVLNGMQSTNISGAANGFFRGNGSVLGFQANMLDMNLPVDDDQYRVLGSRTFRLGATSYSAAGPVSSGSYFDNSVMSHSFSFNFTKYCKKQLKYVDGTTFPTNENVYLAIQVVPANGQTAATGPLAEYHYVIENVYEDA